MDLSFQIKPYVTTTYTRIQTTVLPYYSDLQNYDFVKLEKHEHTVVAYAFRSSVKFFDKEGYVEKLLLGLPAWKAMVKADFNFNQL